MGRAALASRTRVKVDEVEAAGLGRRRYRFSRLLHTGPVMQPATSRAAAVEYSTDFITLAPAENSPFSSVY